MLVGLRVPGNGGISTADDDDDDGAGDDDEDEDEDEDDDDEGDDVNYEHVDGYIVTAFEGFTGVKPDESSVVNCWCGFGTLWTAEAAAEPPKEAPPSSVTDTKLGQPSPAQAQAG
ncbi:unnamed protein product, partial [Symbiodinium microadriaticum]